MSEDEFSMIVASNSLYFNCKYRLYIYNVLHAYILIHPINAVLVQTNKELMIAIFFEQKV